MLRNVGLRKSVEQPVLDLNFAAAQIGSNAAPDARMNDFNRGSNAWFVDSDGLVKKSPHNLISDSEDFSASTTSLGNITVTENSIAAPDGTVTGALIERSSDGTAQRFLRKNFNVPYLQETVATYYLKAGTETQAVIRVQDNTAQGGHLRFTLTGDGAIDSNVGNIKGSIELVGDGWYKCIMSVNETTLTATSIQAILYLKAYGNSNNPGSIYLWHPQVSQHTTLPVDNPYVKTEGSAVYAARLDHDPAWFMSAAQEQNLLEYSEMLDDSGWSKTRLNVTANATTAPDGTTTAEKIFDDSTSSATHNIKQVLDIADATVTNTFSVYFKAAERDSVFLKVYSSNSASNHFSLGNIDLTNGTIGSTTTGGNGTASNSSITDVGDGWFRVTLTGIADTAAGSVEAQIFLNSGGLVYDGDGSSGVFVWGAQFEVGSTASTYHRTEGAPYYGEGATPKGLLIEEQRANTVTYSEDFSQSIYTKTGVTATDNSVLSPSGEVTGAFIAETSATSNHNLTYFWTIDANETLTVSYFIKKAGRDVLSLQNYGPGSIAGGEYANFDYIFSTNSFGTAGTGSNTTLVSRSATDYGNGWVRIAISITYSGGTSGSGSWRIYASDGSGTSYAGDTSKGFYVWGAQVEEAANSFPTSYIQTTGTTLTRNADVATMGPTTGGTELVTNGTFDTDTTGWDDFGGNRSNISVSSGQLVVDVTNAGFGFVARTDVGGGYDPVVVPGRRYRLSADLKVNSGNGVEIDVYGNGSPIAATGIVTSGTLTTKTVDFTCPDGVTSVTLFVDNIAPRATTDEYVVDNVSLRELYPFEQYNPSEGTVVCEFDCVSTTTKGPFHFYEGTGFRGWGIRVINDSGTIIDGISRDASGFNNASVTGVNVSNLTRAVASVNSSGHMVAGGDGNSGSNTGNTVSLPVDRLDIGSANIGGSNTGLMSGHVRRLKYSTRFVTELEAKNLTDD